MKYAIVLGRGVEGCGVTKCAIEASKSLGAPIYATADKRWARRSVVNYPFKEFILGEADTAIKIAEELKNFDVILIFSVPSTGHPETCTTSWRYFIDILKRDNKKMVLLQFDHKKQSLNRNAHFLETCKKMDLLLTHSLTSDFALWLDEYEVEVPLKKMTLGFDFDGHRQKYWLDIETQEHHLVRWIGRATGWKGPTLMMNFHNKHLRNDGFITILEGLEAGIGYMGMLEQKVNGVLTPIDVINKFRPRKELGETGYFEHGEEETNNPPYLYPPYNNDECMDRMAYSAFGSDLYHLDARMYGNNIENCHAEVIACGAIPIFHKHFGDNVVHRRTGNKVSDDLHLNGTLLIGKDEEWNQETAVMMSFLKANIGARDEMRERAFEYWKDHADISVFHQEIQEYSRDLL